MDKCSFGNGIVIKPDGENELDPCVYQTVETWKNVTVRVLRCKRCGHVEIEWLMQDDSEKVDEDE